MDRDRDTARLAQQMQQQLTVGYREEELITTNDATRIPQMQNINKSVCMVKTPGGGHGTGFLADIPGQGVAFLSAGHNFSVVDVSGVKTLHANLDFRQIILHFGNQDGDLRGTNALRTCSLWELGSVMGSIGYGGKRRFFPGNIPATSLPHEDYCFLLLRGQDIKTTLKALDLAYLEVGHGNFLKYVPHGQVIIWGHPANDDIKKEEGGKYPLRQSIGMEMVNNDADSTELLKYDADTLGGNSGSPLIGRTDVP